MEFKRIVFGIFLIVLSASMLLQLVYSQSTVTASLTMAEKAVDFLMNEQFNQSLGLCREAPNLAPNTYWLVSDNLWAWKALSIANAANVYDAAEAADTAEKIQSTLVELAVKYRLPTDADGLPISYCQEAVIGDVASPPYKTETNCTLYNDDYVLNTTMRNGTNMSDWDTYADLLLYAALSCHWQGNDSGALYYYNNASSMWNETSKGLQDCVANATDTYSVYKLALLLYTSKLLGRDLPFESELVDKIYAQQRESDGGIVTDYYANGTSTIGDANTETTAIVIIALLTPPNAKLGTFAFYYPWYGTPSLSGYWNGWNDAGHDPNNFTNGMSDIAATDYPLLGPYDSNDETVIAQQVEWAKQAGIDCFVISWWGINSFEDNASKHVVNVCEQDDFNFTFYIENTTSVDEAVQDINYLLSTYGNSSSWYNVNGRPVIFVYQRARDNLNPQAWNWHACTDNIGNDTNPDQISNASFQWMPAEEVRANPRLGIIPFQPFKNGPGYIETANPIQLAPNEQYYLNIGISDIRNDSGAQSQVGVEVKIGTDPSCNDTLYNQTLHFSDGWQDLSFNITSYAGQDVYLRAESYAVGWSSEWAAADYFFINNSQGQIVSPDPYFDNGWKDVINTLTEEGANPYVIMDFSGYESQVKLQDFMEYFSSFIGGANMYSPLDFTNYTAAVYGLCLFYQEACELAHSYSKTFVATVVAGFNNLAISSSGAEAPHVLNRQNGATYDAFWLAAKASNPDGYAITSFNEWHEGTEIEPSIQYGYQYLRLTSYNTIPEFPLAFLPMLLIISLFLLFTGKRLMRKNQ